MHKGMMDEYCIHIENHLVTDFVELLVKVRNTGTSVTYMHYVPKDDARDQWKPMKQGV